MKRYDFDVIVTLSKQTLTPKLVNEFLDRGATIFRINGSHVNITQARSMIRKIRKYSHKKSSVLIDLPGSKIRFRNFRQQLHIKQGIPFTLREENFNYPDLLKLLHKSNLLYANDGTLPFRLIDRRGSDYIFTSHIDGILQNGRGINVRGEHPPIPFLHEADYQLINLGLQEKIEYLGFSYVRCADDVIQAKHSIKKSKTKAIIKVETYEACKQLEKIIPLTETILIDRGDLASEIGIHNIPKQIKSIVREAQKHKKKILLATQFLYYMVKHPIPSLSEIIALHEAFRFGDGIQLSEETAIGEYPLKALDVIQEGLSVVRGKIKNDIG